MKKEMSRLTLIFASLLISIAAWGVKVHPGPAVIKQSDGTEITVYAYGDCDNHWYATADGVLLYHEGFDYFVAKVDADGNLVPTKQLAHEMTQRSAAEVKLVKAQNRKLGKSPLRMTIHSSSTPEVPRRWSSWLSSPIAFSKIPTPRAFSSSI